jgi:nitroimidazol reductase NimA-like FMN-containing flavoprotein (pyridoxamine 5'-phosphate oxidase superfamily)
LAAQLGCSAIVDGGGYLPTGAAPAAASRAGAPALARVAAIDTTLARTVTEDLVSHARAIVDANLYMVLGTADADGRPWATPVYFAHSAYREFLWVSQPEAVHSRNLEGRAEASIVIFDSTVPISTGQAVYASATAHEVGAEGRSEALEIYTRRSLSHGGREWTADDVVAPARHRLYRATAVDRYVLDEYDDRVAVEL